MRQQASVAVLATIFLGLAPLVRAEVRYTVKDLGALGGTFSVARAINVNGDVVGVSKISNGLNHAFLYRDGALTDLGVPFGTDSAAIAINASGQIVVQSSDDLPKSFLYSNGQFTDLGGLGPLTAGTAINDAAQVVGYTVTSSNETHAFLYSGGTLQDLGTLGALAARPSDINNRGQIVGAFDKLNSASGIVEIHGFLYENGMVQDFGANAGPGAINDLGHSIGTAAGFGPILNRNGEVISLREGAPLALNNADEVVGQAFLDGSNRAVIFENGRPIDLNTLIAPHPSLKLSFATGINDSGQIVGGALYGNNLHAFLLTPIPEPAGISIILLGTAMLLRCPARRSAHTLMRSTIFRDTLRLRWS